MRAKHIAFGLAALLSYASLAHGQENPANDNHSQNQTSIDQAVAEKVAAAARDKAANEVNERRDVLAKSAQEPGEKAADMKAGDRQDVLAQALKDAKGKAGAPPSGSNAVDNAMADLSRQATAPDSGDARAAANLYAPIVGKLVRQNWRWPQTASSPILVCQVELQIGKDGRIQLKRVVRSSGRADFDGSALRAVEETVLPAPPPTSAVTVITLTFNSQEKR